MTDAVLRLPEAPAALPADAVRHVAVVVPVHDEEALLAGCLDAVSTAGRRLADERPDVTLDVVLVLDRCRDSSAAIARARGDVTVVVIDEGNVGAARAAGVARAARRAGARWGAQAWIAHTDADSRVPAHWLTEHVRLAEGGHDVLIGTVRPDPADLTPDELAAWRRTRTARANGHVHGANLGMRASLDAAAGGVRPLPLHEDVDLAARASSVPGARAVATLACDVVTSGRRTARAEGGYAAYLVALFADTAPSSRAALHEEGH